MYYFLLHANQLAQSHKLSLNNRYESDVEVENVRDEVVIGISVIVVNAADVAWLKKVVFKVVVVAMTVVVVDDVVILGVVEAVLVVDVVVVDNS